MLRELTNLNPLFSLCLGQRILHLIACSKSWSTMAQLFSDMGYPQPLHQNDAYGLLLFQLFNRSQQNPYINLTNRSNQTKVSKHHQYSTNLEE
jgi:hypothetical protein